MESTDLAFAGVAVQARMIADGEISSRELVELYLERIGRLDPLINAFRVVFAERALLEADQADGRRGAGGERPLLGVPIAIKDDTDVAGDITALGTDAYGAPAAADAEVVRRLREAGAVILGKTNVPELCIWPFTETVTWGITRNPWDRNHAPGGSSGGSGAAVAAGLVGAAVAADGAGSIRIPAAWCGLFGLKPQRGRVSSSPQPESWHGLTVKGVVTRSVIDSALLYDVIAGSTSIDRDRPDPPVRPYVQELGEAPRKLRIAFSRAIPIGVLGRLQESCGRALDEGVAVLRALGHELQECDPAYGLDSIPAVLVRYLRGIHDEAQGMGHPERLQRRTRSMSRIGSLIPVAVVERSRRHEAALARRLNRIFDDHDVLITPATATPPPRIGQLEGRGALWTLNAVAGMVPYNGIWNVTGQPAASVPMGFGADGLPRAVQLVGRPGDEATLIALAAAIEGERPWADRRPPGFS